MHWPRRRQVHRARGRPTAGVLLEQAASRRTGLRRCHKSAAPPHRSIIVGGDCICRLDKDKLFNGAFLVVEGQYVKHVRRAACQSSRLQPAKQCFCVRPPEPGCVHGVGRGNNN